MYNVFKLGIISKIDRCVQRNFSEVCDETNRCDKKKNLECISGKCYCPIGW